MQTVPIKKLRENAIFPTYATECAAGADLYACLDAPMTVAPHQTVMIPLGYAMELPAGYAGLVYARSGLAAKRDLAPANKVGVIDSDYRGEITVYLYNHSPQPRTVKPGDRIAQLVITPFLHADFEEADTLSETERGEKGFGSTGRN